MNNKEQIEAINAKIDELKAEVQKLEQEPLTMRLVLEGDDLDIVVGDDRVGYISSEGRCYILSGVGQIETYEAWREAGKHVDETPVKWLGGEYAIQGTVLRRIDTDITSIYDLGTCGSYLHCSDPNIKRFKHNNRPIIF